MDPNTRTHSPPLGDNDSPYQPEPPALSGTRSKTPAKSLAFSTASNATHLSLAIRQELSKRAPDGQRCLITRNVKPLEPCYLIPKAISTEEQEKLEYAWGMKIREFTINSTSNLTWLTCDMHGLFDGNCWALVPTKEVLIEIITFSSFKSRSFLERFPEQIWGYHFVLIQHWPEAIMRFTDDKLITPLLPSREADLPASDQPEIDLPAYEVHKYPFEHLRVIKSHVHPFYVTYNAGKKVHDLQSLQGGFQLPS
ncbi:unnamed protein product [Rhizoctonia solani]|uniref:HNH nuclease domain-containing protein n=1 Tax=Rhizoctonia solani TaxID=456999 RepID=A0A8H3HZ17_9AGAM|nr:unnamed protein product [Rhizoctonia solani]